MCRIELDSEDHTPATAFLLSSEDRAQPNPRVSVWMTALTTLEQAWLLTGGSRERRGGLFLEVDKIRSLRPIPPEPVHPGLDVEWEPAMVPDGLGGRMPESRSGFEGHAGIVRLDDRYGTKQQRKKFRVQLADISTVRILTDAELDRIASS